MVKVVANDCLEDNMNLIVDKLQNTSQLVIKRFYIGFDEAIDGAVLYINGLVNKDIIDRDVLQPIMIHLKENLSEKEDIEDYICKKYICMSSTIIESNIDSAIDNIKRGKTIFLIEKCSNFIIIDTTGGNYRQISESENEASIRGPREAFIENLETNISILKRRIKDENLVIEEMVLGKRSQTNIVIMYIKDVADDKLVNLIKEKLNRIDVDFVSAAGVVGQYIEDHTYSIFPQVYNTEKSDVVEANIMEGRIAILIDGVPQVATIPSLFIEYFQTVDDYYDRFIVSSFTRALRIISIFMVITLPSIYLTLIKFNVEIIPLKFIVPIVSSRIGIVLSPFFEIFLMEIVIEILREGGLRLPKKIAQTLSVVGGIIIGQMSIQAKIVSPDTLLVVGVSVIATFLIPNYQMALTIRLIRFPMLVITNMIGTLGIVLVWFVIIVHLLSLDSFGTPYISLNPSDFKDEFIRGPLWTMNKRPEDIATKDKQRQKDLKIKLRRIRFGKR